MVQVAAPALIRLYMWQERTAQRWGNPLSSALDRFSRRHTIIGPVLQAVSLFAATFVVIWALTGFRHTVVIGFICICAVGAFLLLLFNLGYYRWLTTKSDGISAIERL